MRRVLLALTAMGAAAAGVVTLLRRRASPRTEDGWGPAGDDGGRLEYHGPSGDPLEAGAPPDDARLLARVQSELFRDAALPKGDITLDVVGGVVTLRGQVDAALVTDVPVRVAAVEGVLRVQNLLHAPGTPPPTSG